MADMLSNPPLDLVRADYRLWDFTQGIYKVVHNRSTAPRVHFTDRSKFNHYDSKLDASISRARRVVLELGLCNDWTYFCTFTLDKAKMDRNDLKAFHKQFLQWLRDQRKATGLDYRFVLVPELHQDGSWHMHGLFSDISPALVSFADMSAAGVPVPRKLVDGGFYNWPAYQEKFGFCSLGKIRSKVGVGFYIVKYISKSLQDTCIPVGSSLYYPSRPLNRATLHGEVYGACAALDKFLVNHYDFCDTGMTSVKDNCDWTFGLEYMDFQLLDAFVLPDPDSQCDEVDHYWEATQLAMEDFL